MFKWNNNNNEKLLKKFKYLCAPRIQETLTIFQCYHMKIDFACTCARGYQNVRIFLQWCFETKSKVSLSARMGMTTYQRITIIIIWQSEATCNVSASLMIRQLSTFLFIIIWEVLCISAQISTRNCEELCTWSSKSQKKLSAFLRAWNLWCD